MESEANPAQVVPSRDSSGESRRSDYGSQTPVSGEPEKFVALLAQSGELEWYRYLGGATEDGRGIPPLVVWRFAQRDQRFEQKLLRAVGSFHGAVAWSCERPGRNWVLTPTRVLELQQDLSLASDTAALTEISRVDPKFSLVALRDLRALTDHVAAALL
jgi:hypothetical protein